MKREKGRLRRLSLLLSGRFARARPDARNEGGFLALLASYPPSFELRALYRSLLSPIPPNPISMYRCSSCTLYVFGFYVFSVFWPAAGIVPMLPLLFWLLFCWCFFWSPLCVRLYNLACWSSLDSRCARGVTGRFLPGFGIRI